MAGQRAKYDHLRVGERFRLRAVALANYGSTYNKTYTVKVVYKSSKESGHFDSAFDNWQHLYEAEGLPFALYDWEVQRV